MKTILFFGAVLLLSACLPAQTAGFREPEGGGEVVYDKGPCLTEEERAGIVKMLDENIRQLEHSGVLQSFQKTNQAVLFDWPLRKSPNLSFYSYYATNNFVDQNIFSGLLDYNCGARTYEGHFGSDLDTWPFPWYLYDRNLVEVIASEAGVIVGKSDGQEDDHCACNGGWNAIYIQHSDGSVAWYGHLKKNYLTQKPVGALVARGEYLGIVASSGCSTQPHLHFEVYKASSYTRANLIDPYKGTCNNLNAESWWSVQPEYREPTLNALLTHHQIPVHGCPKANENPNLSDAFAPGATIYTAAYFQDQIPGIPVYYRILKPDQTLWNAWTHNVSDVLTKSWWIWSLQPPLEGPYGTWTWEATYRGKTYTHSFVYTPDVAVSEPVEVFRIAPNPTTGAVSITGANFPNARVQIADIYGKVIADELLAGDGGLDISSYASGIYLIKYKVKDKYVIRKVIKI